MPFTVEKALAQLEHESVWVFCAQPNGEEMTAEVTAPAPLPARSPPRVVEAVPPTLTPKVVEAESSPEPSTASTPLVKEENLTVEEARSVPKYGEVVPLKV